MQLARTWNVLAAALDGRLERLRQNKGLVWMPAHQSIDKVGIVKKSDGSRLTAVEWRANRLVDGLAKQVPLSNAALKGVIDLLVSAEHLTRHAAALLGIVTHAANNVKEQQVLEDGTIVVRTRRDSQDPPRGPRKPKGLKEAAKPTANDDAGGLAATEQTAESSPSGGEGLQPTARRRRAPKPRRAKSTISRRVPTLAASSKNERLPTAEAVERLVASASATGLQAASDTSKPTCETRAQSSGDAWWAATPACTVAATTATATPNKTRPLRTSRASSALSGDAAIGALLGTQRKRATKHFCGAGRGSD